MLSLTPPRIIEEEDSYIINNKHLICIKILQIIKDKDVFLSDLHHNIFNVRFLCRKFSYD